MRTRARNWANCEVSCISIDARPRQRDDDVLDDPGRPLGHHDDAVGQENRFGNAVSDEDHRLSIALPYPQQFEIHVVARHGVERAERLVHQQQCRMLDQRAANAGALTHAAGQFVRQAVGEIRDAGDLQKLVGVLPIVIDIVAHQFNRQQNVVEHGAPRQQNRVLEHDAAGALRPFYLPSLDGNRAAAGLYQARDHQQQRALATAGWAQQRNEFVVADVQIDRFDRMNRVAPHAIGLGYSGQSDFRPELKRDGGPFAQHFRARTPSRFPGPFAIRPA